MAVESESEFWKKTTDFIRGEAYQHCTMLNHRKRSRFDADRTFNTSILWGMFPLLPSSSPFHRKMAALATAY